MSAVTDLAADMARAAADFLAALSPAQREQANLPFDDEDERRRWYYFPRQRAPLPFSAMTSRAQQPSALRLLPTRLVPPPPAPPRPPPPPPSPPPPSSTPPGPPPRALGGGRPKARDRSSRPGRC